MLARRLIGAGGAGGTGGGDPGPSITVSYVTTVSTTTDGTSATFNGTSIGATGSNRKIIVVAHTDRNDTTQPLITSITCGGTAMNLTTHNMTSTWSASIAIGALAVASGASANFVVNTTNTSRGFSLQVYQVVGDDIDVSSPLVSATDDTGAFERDVSLSWSGAGGAAFSTIYAYSGATPTAQAVSGSDGTVRTDEALVVPTHDSVTAHFDAYGLEAAIFKWEPPEYSFGLNTTALSVLYQ
jgi:hypothetical protein